MSPRHFRLVGFALMLLCMAAGTLAAQGSSTIKGKVVDAGTGDRLPGANIVLVKSSVGTASDVDGNYVLRSVPPGSWTIKVTFIGYTPVSEDVTVGENATIDKDFRLSPQVLEGQEVVVTAQAMGQMQAINQQLTSNKIASVVSEARIQELPDFNAAAAIGRLPGVSTLQSSGEANKIVIRGLAPEFNAVAVSGITMASTGSVQIGAASQIGSGAGRANQDRSVDLTTVTPYMIKSIEVFKSLTPDLEANAIGGFVNMTLREAPEEFRTDILFQSGYTMKSNNYGNYRLVASASDRFLDNDLGVYALGNIEQYDRDADNFSAGYGVYSSVVQPDGFRPVIVNSVTLNRHLETRKRFGVNLIADYRLPIGSLKLVNVLSRLKSNSRDYRTIIGYDQVGGPITFQYRQGENTVDKADNVLEFTSDLGFLSMELKAANSYSRNFLPYAPQLDFTYSGGVPGGVPPNTIPDSLKNRVQFAGPASTFLSNISLFSADFKENDQVYKADLKVPFSFEGLTSGVFKFGGQFRYNLRTNSQGTPYAGMYGGSPIGDTLVSLVRRQFNFATDPGGNRFSATNFNASDSKLYDTFLNGRFGEVLWVPDGSTLNSLVDFISNSPALSALHNASAINPGGWYDGPFQRLPNKYKYIEKYFAGYLMAELNFGQDVMVVGGVRWEKVRSLYDAYNLADGRDAATQTVDSVFSHPRNHYMLPMVQAKWNVVDWADIRYSYTQTLARPAYTQLSPHFTIGWTKKDVWAGNPKLKPGEATNHDLFLTFHNNELGLLSIGGFYKEIRKFVFYTEYKLKNYPGAPGLDSLAQYSVHTAGGGVVVPLLDAQLHTYMNSPYAAYVRGFEVDLQTRFWYLPQPLDGLVLGINFTRISTKATYPWRDDRTIIVGPRQSKVITVDSTRTGRLINQPNDLLNAYVGYDYGGFSGRVSFLFQGNSVNNVGAFSEQDGFTKDYFRIDVSARQKLPWFGLQVFLDITNLNNSKNNAAQASIDGFTSQQYYGLVANLGLRFVL